VADFAMCRLVSADLMPFRSAWTVLNTPRGLTDDDILGGEPHSSKTSGRPELVEGLEAQMADQSRLDFLERRVEEQSRNWERLFTEFGRVDQKIDRLDQRIDLFDQKIDRLDLKIDRLDQKIDAFGIGLSNRIDTIYGALDGRIDALRVEQVTQFRWTIGIMTALITGVLAAILTR
jgi:hypothetical protein